MPTHCHTSQGVIIRNDPRYNSCQNYGSVYAPPPSSMTYLSPSSSPKSNKEKLKAGGMQTMSLDSVRDNFSLNQKGEVVFKINAKNSSYRLGYVTKDGSYSSDINLNQSRRYNYYDRRDGTFVSSSYTKNVYNSGRYNLDITHSKTTSFSLALDKQVETFRMDVDGRVYLFNVSDVRSMLHQMEQAKKQAQSTPKQTPRVKKPQEPKTVIPDTQDSVKSPSDIPYGVTPSKKKDAQVPLGVSPSDGPTRIPFGVSPSNGNTRNVPLGVSPTEDQTDSSQVPLGVTPSASSSGANIPLGVSPSNGQSKPSAVPFGVSPSVSDTANVPLGVSSSKRDTTDVPLGVTPSTNSPVPFGVSKSDPSSAASVPFGVYPSERKGGREVPFGVTESGVASTAQDLTNSELKAFGLPGRSSSEKIGRAVGKLQDRQREIDESHKIAGAIRELQGIQTGSFIGADAGPDMVRQDSQEARPPRVNVASGLDSLRESTNQTVSSFSTRISPQELAIRENIPEMDRTLSSAITSLIDSLVENKTLGTGSLNFVLRGTTLQSDYDVVNLSSESSLKDANRIAEGIERLTQDGMATQPHMHERKGGKYISFVSGGKVTVLDFSSMGEQEAFIYDQLGSDPSRVNSWITYQTRPRGYPGPATDVHMFVSPAGVISRFEAAGIDPKSDLIINPSYQVFDPTSAIADVRAMNDARWGINKAVSNWISSGWSHDINDVGFKTSSPFPRKSLREDYQVGGSARLSTVRGD